MRKIQQYDYSNGENSRDDITSLAPNEASELLNLYPGAGRVYAREGSTTYQNNNSLSTNLTNEFNPKRVIPWDNKFGKFVMIFFQDDLNDWKIKVRKPDGTDVDVILSTYTFNGIVSHTFVDNMMLFHDGNNLYRLEPVDPSLEYTDDNPDNFKLYPHYVDHFVGAPWAVVNSGLELPDLTLLVNGYQINQPYSGYVNQFNGSSYYESSAGTRLGDGRDVSLMYGYYAISYVRRKASTVSPVETYEPGIIETSIDFNDDVRLFVTRKFPLRSYFNSSTPGYEENYVKYPATSILEGQYYTDGETFVYKALENISGTAVIELDNEGLARVSFSDTTTHEDEKIRATIFPPAGLRYNTSPGGPGFNPPTLDPTSWTTPNINLDQMTHMRVYRTLLAPSPEEAKAQVFRFLVDIPIDNVNASFDPWFDDTSDAELLGSDNTYNMFNTQRLPISGPIKFYNGRIWSGVDDKAFYSLQPLSPVSAIKWVGLSNTATDFISIGVEDKNTVIAIDSDKEDLVIMAEDSIWVIRDGDPTIAGPEKVSDSMGIVGPRALVKNVDGIYYLSILGPAIYKDRQVNLVNGFKAEAVWPTSGRSKTNTRLSPELWSGASCFLSRDAWMIFNEQKDSSYDLVGYYYGASTGGSGAFKVKFPESFIVRDIGSFSDRTVVSVIGGGDQESWLLENFKTNVVGDFGLPFKCLARSKGFYGDQDKNGVPDRNTYQNLYDIKLYGYYDDQNYQQDFQLALIFDEKNRVETNTYFRPTPDNSDNQQGQWDLTLQYGVREGCLGNIVQVEWSTETLSTFRVRGFDYRYIPERNPVVRFADGNELLTLLDNTVGVSGFRIEGGTTDRFEIS